MKKIKLFFTMLSVLVCAVAFAQNTTVTGVVTDASTGEPIPFASVHQQNTTNGTSSDAVGKYSIRVPNNAVIVVSSVGYKTKTIQISGAASVNVSLEPDAEFLDETIVVAFGTSTKSSFTGSATVVKSDEIAKVQTSNATRALEGVVPGVQMTTSSGKPGSNPTIMIRGISSISAGTAPLVVVDGVPYSGDMNNINPNDIESMTVLKDAASNALYGSRGANGVIMITTKKGKAGDAQVNIDAKWGWNTKALQNYDYITDPGLYYETHYGALKNYYMLNGLSADAAHQMAAANVAGPAKNGGLGYLVYTLPEGQNLIGSNGRLNPDATLGRVVNYQGQDFLLTPDDWTKEAYKQSLRQEYNINVTGATDKANFYASFGYLNDKGIVDGADMYRYSARLKADYQAKKWLKVGANFGYTNFNWNLGGAGNESAGSTGSVFGYAASMAPIYPLYMRDGNGNFMYDSRGLLRYDYGDGANGGMTRPNGAGSNPLQATTLDISNSEGNALNVTGFAEVSFLKYFKAILNVGTGLDETRSKSVNNSYYGQFAANGGSIQVGHERTVYFNMQELITYDQEVGQHHISAMLGHENYNTTSYTLSASKTGLFSMENLELNGAIVDAQSAASSQGTYNNEGYFLRAQYDYAQRYFLSASYRLDASSRFHPKHRWGSFWSVGAGWLINHENWFNASWVDMLKLKASIGSQGNDNIGNYKYIDTYTISNNEGELAVTFNTKGNENITWETNTNFNVGVDFDFFRSRLSGTVEYFYRKTSDMLFFFPVPESLGYSGYYDNIGDMRNAGVEFAINGVPVRTKDIEWNIYVNATHYTNKVVRLPEERKTVEMEGYKGYANGNKFIGEGLPLNTFKMRKYAGVDQESGLPMWYKDVTNPDTKEVTRETTTSYDAATDYLCSDTTPKLYGGFGTSFRYRWLDIAVAFTYSIGGLTYDSGYAALMAPPGGSLGQNYHKDVLKAWTAESPSSDIPRFVYNDQNINATSDRFLTDASYLNFQNAQIGFTLPAKWTKAVKISKFRIYASCDNIWYWSRRQGLDPRYSFSGSTNQAAYSPVRTISGGINITF